MREAATTARIGETPEADTVEQHLAVLDDEGGLDPSCLAHLTDREANEADVIEQATVVPVAADEPPW
ncbi:hypothetical protein [Mycobacterium botniense]|uniref:Uncharacterized protein n=1 Tax=Mycobacterium botniense TaxID=84962 RepID=A0A7I9XSC4_9MYCO|nr:hypothetical protein [Mycobacterium botniense]GFG72844.1 hypothetical protein MBOT_02090 [Mycobacterium botniense]